jgi:chromatin remodeling complex protein RSC6
MNNETEVKVPANVKKLEKTLQNMEILMKEQHTRMNHLEKEFTHFKKMACSFIENIRKNCEKKPRKASGFVLPGPISNELCDFLDIPHGTQASRTEVTKYLISYIDENELIDPEKKTLVVPNDRLHALLGPTVDLETLTRFTMQKYMNRHYLPRENIRIS